MTLLDVRPALRPVLALPRRGLVELALLSFLYVAYSATRLVADDAEGPATDRALALLDLERAVGLDWERPLNDLFAAVDWLGVAGSFWYATAHYVVTAGFLVWLYRRGAATYVPARRALLLATVAGLALYLLLPMAPPRLMPEYVDVLDLHASTGWWGAEASAPRGLGGLTNQLAAFPSLHAGWALWVALAVRSATTDPRVRALGWSHAAITAVVIVGTGNHWVLDAVVGWLLVAAAWAATSRRGQRLVWTTTARVVGIAGFRPGDARAGFESTEISPSRGAVPTCASVPLPEHSSPASS